MTRRYSLQALVDASGLSESTLGRRVRLSGSTLKQAREHGLTERAADRCAVRLDLHPFEVWPDWFTYDDDGFYKKSRPRRLHPPGEIAGTVVYRNVAQRLRKQGLSVERYQLAGFSLAERALLAERENAARGTPVEQSETPVSPGHSGISVGHPAASHAHDVVAA